MPAEEILSHAVSGANWCVRRRLIAADLPTIILLHGFTGSGEDFRPLLLETGDRSNWITVDLPGHGKSDQPDSLEAYTLRTVLGGIESVLQLAPDPRNILLAGYSMGARVALHYLDTHSACRGILISGSPGLQDADDRAARIATDTCWIRKLEYPAYAMEDFCREWEQQPVIQSQLSLPEPLRSEIAFRRRNNSKRGLANSLRALGTGALPGLWEHLPRHSPHLLIVGEDDDKFRRIARTMQQQNKDFHIHTIDQSGHAPHLENPAQTARAILDFLKQKPATQSSS